MSVNSYSPDKVIFTVNGVPISGYIDNEMIDIETQKEDDYSLVTGCDGADQTFIENMDKQGSMKISLASGSTSVSYISGIYNSQQLYGPGKIVVSCTDINTGSTHFCGNAALAKPSSKKYGDGLPGLEYTFICPKIYSSEGTLAIEAGLLPSV